MTTRPSFEDVALRRLLEALPCDVVMVDEGRHVAFSNRQAELLFGYGRDELAGAKLSQVIPNFEQAAADAQRARDTGGADAAHPHRQAIARHKSGETFPVELGLSPVATQFGAFTLAVVADVRERRHAHIAQQRLAAIVASSQDAILSKTLEGVVTSWNRGAEQMFGYSADEAVGKSVFMLVPERLLAEEHEVLRRIRRNEAVPHFETTRVTKAGHEIQVSITLSPVLDLAGCVTEASAIVRDLSALHRQDAELRRSNAELEQFAYVASHDLQEPLRMVANYTELIAERYRGKLDEKADLYIFYASDGARRMQRLVQDLLAYSRVGSSSNPKTAVALNSVFDDVFALMQQPLREAGGGSVERGELPTVLGDETQLRQLFQNLVANAIKFHSEQPVRVTVSALPQGKMLRISIADNGIGIDPKHAERVFQMFQRLHGRGQYDGSGIGLSIARRIVQRHNGQIWFEANADGGTTFHLTLPAAGVPS